MVELAVRDGFQPPADLPTGEFMLWPTGTGDQFTIARADPRILISGELLEAICRGDGASGVSFERDCVCSAVLNCHHRTGGALKIHGVNRTVIYRIGEYLPAVHGYIGEWPD